MADPTDSEPQLKMETGSAKRRKRFSKANIELVKANFEKRGIVYLGRVPPRMVVPLTRVAIQGVSLGCADLSSNSEDASPELSLFIDIEDFKERKRNGGCAKRGFVEGWVEFLDKKIAKKFVRRYNGEPIGGKKRNPFCEEIWCVKYLSKFKWDHLLEGIRYRKILYQREIQQELADAKKQQEMYLNRVQIARRLENSEKSEESKVERAFTQIEPLADPVLEQNASQVTDGLLALFGGR